LNNPVLLPDFLSLLRGTAKLLSVKYAVQDKNYLTAFVSALAEQSHNAGKGVRDV